MPDSDRVFGALGLKMGMARLGDGAGLLRKAERRRVERSIRRFGCRFPQLFFAVRTVALEEPVSLQQFGFWLLNRAEFSDLPEAKGNDGGVLLVVDAESRTAGLTWGYRVDPFLGEANTFKILTKAHPFFLEGDWCRGMIVVARSVDKVLRRSWWKSLAHQGNFGFREGARPRTVGPSGRVRWSDGNEAKA